MKNKKFSLLLNIATIALCVCAIAIGVYSAKQTSLSIGGSISFTAYSNANVVCKVTGAKLASETSYSNKTYYITSAGVTTDSSQNTIKMTKDTPALSLSALSFAYDETTKEPLDMVLTFTIKNTSSDVIVADLNIDNLVYNYVLPSWGTDGALQIISPTSNTSATGDVKSGSADIVLTLKLLKSVDIASAISGSMNLNIEKAEKTADGFVVNSSGQLTAVPSTTETNASITIPAYYYDGNNTYKKITDLYPGSTSPATNMTKYASVTISNGISTGAYAFKDCTSLTSVKLPGSMISFSKSSFEGCTALSNIVFPKATTTITSDSFAKCKSIISITIPAGVEKLGSTSFQSCTNLKNISFEEGCKLTSIDMGAFANCSNLTTINYQGTKAQWNAITFGSSWNVGTGSYTVKCIDGDIAKS